jgi:signal transduction histidine kinase
VMAGGIAHEVRNPLAVCGSAAQFLLEQDLTPEFITECAKKIHTGVQRASRIIENLLRFARPSTPGAMESVDLVCVIQDALALMANEAKLQKISVTCQLTTEPVLVKGNMNMLTQLFSNVFLNAFTAMPRGGTLEIRSESVGHEVMVAITDSGCGIRPEHLGKVFDPFFSTKAPGEGTGLGLSICHSIAEHHSGSVAIDSGQGWTRFTVRLPLLADSVTSGTKRE